MARSDTLYEAHRPFIRKVAGPLALVFAMFYLGFHALSGERGLFALFTESRKLATLQSELLEVKTRREALEHKVRMLSSNSLDTDLLDEQVRHVLGKVGKGEVVYFEDAH